MPLPTARRDMRIATGTLTRCTVEREEWSMVGGDVGSWIPGQG